MGEIRALTGLRIVAALWVVLIHFQFALADGLGGYLAPVMPIVLSGWLGVDLFFVLSGFVMVHSYLTRLGPRLELRSTIGFLWARLARIWPLWAVLSTGFFVWLVVTGYDPGGPAALKPSVSLPALGEQLALVQMWHRHSNLGASLIGPGWSLSVEFLAYLSFPLLVLVLWRMRRLSPAVLAVLAVGAMVPMALLAYRSGLADYNLPWLVRIAGAFVSGGLACLFVHRVRDNAAVRRVSASVAVVCVVELLAICFWSGWRVQNGGPNQVGIAVVVLPVLVAALALSDTGLARVLSREPFVLGGRISFALYLVHVCVLEFVNWLQPRVPQLANGSSHWTLLRLHLIPICLVAAYVLWRWVEEPSRRYLVAHSPVRRRPPARPTPARHEAASLPVRRPVAPRAVGPVTEPFPVVRSGPRHDPVHVPGPRTADRLGASLPRV